MPKKNDYTPLLLLGGLAAVAYFFFQNKGVSGGTEGGSGGGSGGILGGGTPININIEAPTISIPSVSVSTGRVYIPSTPETRKYAIRAGYQSGLSGSFINPVMAHKMGISTRLAPYFVMSSFRGYMRRRRGY